MSARSRTDAAAPVEVERDVMVEMRDGCRLAADVYRPPGAERELPVLLLRTPYDRRQPTMSTYPAPAWLCRQGFLVVAQDCRGRYGSEGEFAPFANEAADGCDTIAWAAALDGGSGAVGTFGASYCGYLQLLAAAERPPALRAIAPAVAGRDLCEDWFFPGGALSLAFASWWATDLALANAVREGRDETEAGVRLAAIAADPRAWYGSAPPAGLEPVATEAPYYRDWLGRGPDPTRWTPLSLGERLAEIDVPCLAIGGWYDAFNEGTVETFAGLSGNGGGAAAESALGTPHRLLVGPWGHVPWAARVGALDFGGEAWSAKLDEALVAFMRRHLGAPAQPAAHGEAPVGFFVLFENRWREADTWPPAETSERILHLNSGGGANSAGGDGQLREAAGAGPGDVYVYSPAAPVPSAGGCSCCWEELAPVGPADQAAVERRRDVLVYDTEPLERPLLLAGPATLELHVRTEAADADYVARLCRVDREGRSVNVTEGVLRATRELAARSSDAEAVPLTVAIRNVAARLEPGERLRLALTSGSFPAYSVNPQSGTPPLKARRAELVPASHEVLHDAEHPSLLRLTVLPER